LGCSKRLKGKDISGGWNKKTPLVRGNSLSLAGTHQYWQYSAAFDNTIHFQAGLVQVRPGVALGRHPLQARVLSLDGHHGVVNQLADVDVLTFKRSQRSNVPTACPERSEGFKRHHPSILPIFYSSIRNSPFATCHPAPPSNLPSFPLPSPSALPFYLKIASIDHYKISISITPYRSRPWLSIRHYGC
jgi:hypothetical protein